jgi:hypothetical protein
MLVAGAALGLLIALDPASVYSARTQPPVIKRAVEGSASVAPGGTRSLYSVRGFYGRVGEFSASCTSSGIARTFYTPDAYYAGPPVIAVEGRGASRAARPIASAPFLRGPIMSRPFPGGPKPSGIEHWIMYTGGKPENVSFDVTLLALSTQPGLPSCAFSLNGTLVIRRH